MEPSMTDFLEPKAGFEFSRGGVVVSDSEQNEKLTAIGLDASIFADVVDPTFFIDCAIHAVAETGVFGEETLHLHSRIRAYRTIQLGEELIAKGRLEAVAPAPGGRQVTAQVSFQDANGEQAITVSLTSLTSSTDRLPQDAGEDLPSVVTDVAKLERFDQYWLTTDAIVTYLGADKDKTGRAGNKAVSFSGGMGVHFLLSAIWGAGRRELDIDVHFRRPIFSDQEFQVGEYGDELAMISDGRVLIEARVNLMI